ncbi:MIP/aquaporin family protein [uncultured Maribacter sp.]|uniref:MIP/aquaporin family protein n=1 Tax=uncultured Maribacter sp. TaxID=431308 RepID=UPI0030EBA681|tara:strand:- start:190895 stop:191632 length:738 start_codon:yes stop_codon:yes gene_type:complete
MSPFVAEFFGTFLLLLLGLGTNANVALNNTFGQNSGWIVISFGWGLSVFAAVAVAGPYSGAHINPAVTIGLASSGLFAWSEVPSFLLAQVLGGATGATLVWLIFKDHFASTKDQGTKLGVFSTGPAIKNYPINFLSEMTGTFVLMFVILYFTEPQFNTDLMSGNVVGLGSVGALPVALLVTVIGLSLGGTTGYAINPVRDLIPRIMHAVLPIPGKGGSNWKYSWIPVLAPITGAVIASLIYLYLK